MNVPFDLSKVVFVATANRLQPIPPPLRDRMEVIELPGYTPEEKLHIAMQHLIPRVLDQHGLSSEFLQIPEVPNVLYKIVSVTYKVSSHSGKGQKIKGIRKTYEVLLVYMVL